MYFRMILFSYTCIVSILAFVVAVNADTQQTFNNNEISLSRSNEQFTEYKYEKTVQSATTENNQDHSITTNINTEIVQKIHSSNELDLNNADSTDLNVNIMSNMQSNLEISKTEIQLEGDTAFMSPNGFKDSSNDSTPTNPNADTTDKPNEQEYDSNGNKLSDTGFISSYQASYYGYNIQNTGDENGDLPSTDTSSPGSNDSPSSGSPTSLMGVLTYPQTSIPNSISGAPNVNGNGGTPSTTTPTSDSNGSPTSPYGDLTDSLNGEYYDASGNKLSDTGFMSSYQASYYGYNIQNTGDENGDIPTTATSSPGSNDSPSSASPTSLMESLNSVSSDVTNLNGVLSQPYIPLNYPIGVPRNIDEGVPNYPQTSIPNSISGAPNLNGNGGTPSTATPTSDSNGSPTSPNGDLTDSLNGEYYDSNGNKLIDTGFMSSYQASYYGYNIQNTGDENGDIPTTATSSPGSNDSPSSGSPTSLMGVLTYPQTSIPNSISGAPNVNGNGGTPSTATPTSDSNGSPTSPYGDLTDSLNGEYYDASGNKLSDTGFMSSYQASYYGYNIQNTGDENGDIPTTATSSPGSNDSPSSASPTSLLGSLNSVSSDVTNLNGVLSQPYIPLTYPIGVPRNIDEGVPNYPQTSIPNSISGAPNLNGNGGTPSTATPTSDSNGSPTSPNGDLTDSLNGEYYDSNGNKLIDTGFMSSYQASYYGYNIQNTGDENGDIPTTATSSPGSNDSPSSGSPTSLMGVLTYPQTSIPNSISGSPNLNGNGATPSTATPTSDSNGSPTSPNGDLTDSLNGEYYDASGNKLSDTGFMSSYQASYYGYNIQNTGDENGDIPTTATSSPGSNDSPSSGSPTSLMGVLTYPQTSIPNSISGSPNLNGNGGTPSTATPTSDSNGSPTSPYGDLTDSLNGEYYDASGNKLSDTGFMSSYQASYYGYNIQNTGDENGDIPTTATSSPGSNDSPSSASPTSLLGSLNSVSSDVTTLNGVLSQPYIPLTYPIGVPKNIDEGVPNYPQTSIPNSISGAPNLNGNGGTPSTATPTSDSNGSPTSPNGDLTDSLNGEYYDSNGNKLIDTGFMSSYQASYYGYNIQNTGDENGDIPTTATSSPGSNDSPSSGSPTSLMGVLTYPQTSIPNSISGAPNLNGNGGTPSTATPTSDSNGSPTSPYGDLTDSLNGEYYDASGNKLSDTGFMSSYQASYYGYNIQNTGDENGDIPTTATSSPGSNDSPSSASPTSLMGSLNSVSSDVTNLNGVLSQPYIPLTYPIGVPRNIDEGVPNYPQTSIPNSISGAPNLNGNGGTPSTATPTSDSNGSPTSPNGDLTDSLNGEYYDSNGNKLIDTGFMSSYQASYYGYNIQNTGDENGDIPTTATSSPGSNDSPSSASPTSLMGSLNSVSSDVTNLNGVLSQPYIPLTYPIGVPKNIDEGVPNYPQTSIPNSISGAPNLNGNGGTPSTATPTSNLNGSPTSPYGDLTDSLNGESYDANGNKLSDTGFMNSYQASYYGYNIQNTGDENGDLPFTDTSSPGSNDFPLGASPTSFNGDSMDKLNGGAYDSNGQKLMDNSFTNSYQSSNYYGYIPSTADEESSYTYPPEMSEDLNNQITQNSLSTFNFQNTVTPDQFGLYPSISPTLPNGNSNNSPNDGGPGLNGAPLTVDQSLTGTEYSSMSSDMYRYPNYDIGSELQNMDEVEGFNNGQLNTDEIYISDKYDDLNNEVVNVPVLNENGDVYNNNYFYAENSVNRVRNSEGNYDTQNGGSYDGGYFENVPFDSGNPQELSYDSYAPDLNAMYESRKLQYGVNQDAPPFGRDKTFIGNDIEPYVTNNYPDNSPQISVMNSDLYNYNNKYGIEYDQTKIGIDETNPENNQLSMNDFNTFSNTQIPQTTDSFISTDLTSDHPVYDFVDADNRDVEKIDSNYIGQVNGNNVYSGQGFNGNNIRQSINVPEYNQLNGDYTTTYLSNSRTFETSSSNTGTDGAVDGPEGPYLTPQLLNSEYNLLPSNSLNKQNSDLNSLLIDNVQLNGYLYSQTDTSNVNTQAEGSTVDNSNGSPMNAVDNRLKSIQTRVLSKNIELDVGQNVYGANGQVIGKIYKPSGIVKTNNRHKYSGSSSYSSTNDSEFSDDMHAIGHDMKRAARDAIGNAHDNIKDAYDTTKAVGNAVGNIAGNAVNKGADKVGEAANDTYQGAKNIANGVGNAVDKGADKVGEAANDTYQGAKNIANGVGNAVDKGADKVGEAANDTYEGAKYVANGVGNSFSDAV